MSNKIKTLSKKQKRIFSRLIKKRLESMGIKDEITMQPSGKKVKRPVLKSDGFGFEVDENGLIKIEDVDIMLARNLQRNMIKNLRNSTLNIVKGFLSVGLKNKETKEKENDIQEN